MGGGAGNSWVALGGFWLDISLKEPPLLALSQLLLHRSARYPNSESKAKLKGENTNRKGFKKNKPSRRAYRKVTSKWQLGGTQGFGLPTPHILSPKRPDFL